MKVLLEVPDDQGKVCVTFYERKESDSGAYFVEYWSPVQGRPDLFDRTMIAEVIGKAIVRRADAQGFHLLACEKHSRAILDVVLVNKIMLA